MASALPHARNTVLFVGYQAAGTRGRSLLDGAHELRIHGHPVPVQAHVAKIDSMSAHADRGEILRWLATAPAPPGRVCLVHGEPQPMDALKGLIAERFGWATSTPTYRETITL
jgi:metallo-beta-lactamase family protein